MDERNMLHRRDPRHVCQARAPRLHHRANHGYRLEVKGAVRRAKKISNAHIFEATVSRDTAQRRLVDDLLGIFGGRSQPVMAHLIEAGKTHHRGHQGS
jgi:hypothetical protein